MPLVVNSIKLCLTAYYTIINALVKKILINGEPTNTPSTSGVFNPFTLVSATYRFYSFMGNPSEVKING